MVTAIMVRDGGMCAVCGAAATTANHRANRGSGGSRTLNRPSNGVAICELCNGLIEDDTPQRKLAIDRGIKIRRPTSAPNTDPSEVLCWSPLFRMLVFFGDDWTIEFPEPGSTIRTAEAPGTQTPKAS